MNFILKDTSHPGPSSKDGANANLSFTSGSHTLEKPYSIAQDRTVKKWKTGVEERVYSVKFHPEKAGEATDKIQIQLIQFNSNEIKC